MSEPAPPPFLPPAEVDAPAAELVTDPLPWNPAFIAHHKIAGVTITSPLAGSERGLEDTLRFDAAGHLLERHLRSGPDPIGTWGLEWKDGRLVQVTETLPGGATRRTTVQYDGGGRPVEIAHPDEPDTPVEQRSYDANGALASRRWTRGGAPAGEERIERDAGGRMVAAVRQGPNGDRIEERRTYEGDRLVGVTWSQPGASKSWRLSYDAGGRVARIDIDGSGSEVFTYDQRGFPQSRTRTAPPAPPQTIAYEFDQPRETP
ncbi:MAG TPA: hypothetical protein VFU21_32005 [Kofleriaceae bacterium]|nr:hypothetical protein [Kofleriaceae bacterium]